MTTPYKVLGEGIATMLGRKSELKKILRKLERETPEHTSVIGAKYIGKTVFLNAVSQHFEANKGTFNVCVYWDISRYTPTDDADFFKKFGAQLLNRVADVGDEYEDFFKSGTFEALKDAFEELGNEKKRVLIIIDNLDKLLQIGHLSKDAWDNLRTLGELSSVWFVTGSRKRLRELIGSPEIQGSPFWNLFGDTPMTLTAFGDEDWSDFLAPFDERKIIFGKGANAELENYTGGTPILASAFCINLWEKLANDETITNETVVEMAKDFVAEKQDILKEIWNGCSDEQGTIEDLANERIDKSSVHPKELTNLENNGIVLKKNGKVCRLMKEFLDYEQPQIKDLERIFGDEENFKKNLKRILRLRVNQLLKADETLISFLSIMIENIDEHKVFLAQLRSFADHSLELIWKKDLPDGEIPSDWVDSWKHKGRLTNNLQDKPILECKIPVGGTQLKLLNLMTEAREQGTSSASRATYLMLSYIYSIGNFGHHRKEINMVEGDYEVPEEFAYAVCLEAIELCYLLTKDLQNN